MYECAPVNYISSKPSKEINGKNNIANMFINQLISVILKGFVFHHNLES